MSYLGYLGTMGADFIDYVIADEIALPFDQQRYYTEKIVHLPDCFLVNDNRLEIAPHMPSRDEAGLPAEGFVFCSFNNSYKLAPADIRAVDAAAAAPSRAACCGSPKPNPDMAANLRREAQRCGIDAGRSFSRRVFRSPSTWHGSAWPTCFSTPPRTMPAPRRRPRFGPGVPVLTCWADLRRPDGGEHAACCRAARTGRRIACGLRGAGAQDRHGAGILRIAKDKARAQPRNISALRHRALHRHIEDAYVTMWQAYQARRPPANFAVFSISRTPKP